MLHPSHPTVVPVIKDRDTSFILVPQIGTLIISMGKVLQTVERERERYKFLPIY